MKGVILGVVIASVLSGNGESARILGAVFTPSYSHQVAFQPIWRELSLRGHRVTVLTTDPMKDPTLTNLTEIDLSMSYEVMKMYKTDELLSNTNGSFRNRLSQYMDALHATADVQLSNLKVQDLIHNHRADFDLLMVEVIYPTQIALAWWFNLPFIGMISLDAPPRIHEVVGNPTHPVLYPDFNMPFDNNLTFMQRLTSMLFSMLMMWYGRFKLYPSEDITVSKHFGNDVPTLKEIESNMSLLFINSNPIFQPIRPLVPTTIQIGGGLHLKKPKSLPDNIQKFLDGAIDGFVYFSLGTNVKSASLSESTKSAILGALAELPFKVLWKFEDKNIPYIPKNVKIFKWIQSQTAVLAHPHIKAFVTQCGLQSMEEAIFYNVPMVGLPFFGDQLNNAKALETKKLGVQLEPTNLQKDDLLSAIKDVILYPM